MPPAIPSHTDAWPRISGGPASRGHQRNGVYWMVQGQFATRIAPAPEPATTGGMMVPSWAQGDVRAP